MPSRMIEKGADATVYDDASFLYSVVLTAGSDAATVIIRDGGSGGTERVTLKAAANESATWRCGHEDGVHMATDIHADLTGTSPVVDVEFEPHH